MMAIHEFIYESCLKQAKAFSTSTVKVQGRLGVLIIMWPGKLITRVRLFPLRAFWGLTVNDALSARFLTALTTKQDYKTEYQRQTRTQKKFQREKYYSNIAFLLLFSNSHEKYHGSCRRDMHWLKGKKLPSQSQSLECDCKALLLLEN